jgi:hypothetical protein
MAQAPRAGLFQYLKWGTGSADTDAGLVNGGDLNLNPDLRQRLGIGGTVSRRGGVVVPEGSMTAYVTHTNQALFAAALRASYPRGALTEHEFEGGMDEFALAYHEAVITDMTLNYTRGEGLQGTLSWGGMTASYNDTGGSQGEEANPTFEDYEFVVEFESNEYYVNECSITLGNNVSFHTSGNTKSAGFERFPTHRTIGAEDLSVSFATDIPLPMSELAMYDQCQADDLEIVLTGTGCAHTLTLTLTDLMLSDAVTMAFVDASTIGGFGYGFVGDAWNGSLDWGWA